MARRSVEAGASIVNEVSGGLADPAMAWTVAALDVRYVATHWRDHSTAMNRPAVYGDVVSDVVSELELRISASIEAGIRENKLVIDPGLGFAKST